MRALRHRKGWKYRVAKQILGSTRWDPAKWDRDEVNAGLARLAKLWAKQAALKAKAAAADQAATETAAKTAPARKKSRPGNGRLRDDLRDLRWAEPAHGDPGIGEG
jgi:hypothetical protein